MHFMDVTVDQDVADQQDTPTYQDALHYQDMLHYQDALHYQDKLDTERTMDDAPIYQDTSNYDQDTVTDVIQDSSSRLFVGVITDHAHLSRTMRVAMDTWGQSSPNLTFYSLTSSERGEDAKEEEETWVWHVPRRHGKRRRRGEDAKEEEMWAWHGRRRGRGTGRVVNIKYGHAKPSAAPPGAMATIPVLRHMQINLMDRFDWFLLVPEDVYVRLDQLEDGLKEWDSNVSLLFGRADSAPHEVGVAGGCGLERGVVLSKRYLWDLTGEMEALIDSGVCRAGPSLWRCLYRHVVGQDDGGLDCIHDDKV